jgi:hypothetical protein
VSIIIPKLAEEAMLDLILAEGYTLRLFTNDVTAGLTEAQIEALTAGSFTEATFTGYAAVALTGGAWVTTALDAPSTGVYAQQTFTRTVSGAAQVVRGYYVTRTTGGALRWFQYFPGPLTVTNNGDAIVVTPTITLDDQEATVTARGVIARQTPLTANSTGYTTDITTDFAITNVVVDSTRLYKPRLRSQFLLSASGVWDLNFYVDGVLVDRIFEVDETVAHRGWIDSGLLWEPATDTVDIDLRLDERAGASTLTFEADAVNRRYIWVEDVGPR